MLISTVLYVIDIYKNKKENTYSGKKLSKGDGPIAKNATVKPILPMIVKKTTKSWK